MSVDIGIDLGTASILVYVKGKESYSKNLLVVAFDRDSNESERQSARRHV